MKYFATVIGMLSLGLGSVLAEGWPTHKGNASRDGYTAEELPGKLALRWSVKSVHPPAPAWPVSSRLGYDRAFHPVAVGDSLFFGSSADGRIVALDAATGKERWAFHTGGPVRFAPAIWKDRLFTASDDGCLYCNSVADGKLLWKKQGGPSDKMFLANDRMASRWPARGGPVVFEDTVYFAAGVWPSEGIYLYALQPDTGKVIWCNDQSGSIFMGQPHGGAYAASGASAQGYIVVNDDQLMVPTGRAVPAVYERSTGKFLYFKLQANAHKGGASTFAIGPHFFNAGYTYDSATGQVLDPIGAGDVAAIPEGLVLSTGKDVSAFSWVDKEKKEKTKLELIKYKGLNKLWTVSDVPGGTSVIVAGKSIICGGNGTVTIVDRVAKKITWSAQVDGVAHGLAASNKRLFVSTDKGTIYCFDGEGAEKPTVHETPLQEAVYGENAIARAAAEEILKSSEVREGYCVDLGCGDGALAYELARNSKLQIYAVESDPEKVALARKRLTAAGLYGMRVTVHQGDPAKSPYPKSFADLVVSSRSMTDGSALKEEVKRLQRPYGGVAVLGKAGSMTKDVAAALPGAGQWTHQYADPGNTCCSADDVVQGNLGMLWFRDSDLDSPSRHGRAPAPLFFEGRLIVEGMDAIRAVNAYNGRRLWEYALPNILKPYQGEHLMGTAGTHSNLCIAKEGLFVRVGNKCLRIDPATGKKLAEFEAPKDADGKVAPWGYIACENGILFGSIANMKHIVRFAYGASDMSQLFTESTAFFALDAVTGKLKWHYTARESIRHNAIAIGNGKVFLIDRSLAAKDLFKADKTKEIDHPIGEMISFDAATGRELWRNKKEIYGTMLAYSAEHDTLVMSYQPTRFKLPSELGGRLAAFNATKGEKAWDVEAKYTTRPLINGKIVYAEGGAWDVVSGETKPFTLKRSYGCGQLTSSKHLMLFRSATLGIFDLQSPRGVTDYGGMRPGCWINAIPAGGLVLVPDATSGCQCSYLNQAWVVLQPQ